MRIDGSTIFADEGWILRRKSDKELKGTFLTLGYTYYIGGVKLDEPHLEVPEDYEEVTEEMLREEKMPAYESLVEAYIRERYSPSKEFAIQRQRDTKPDDFQKYFDYCEECKERAKSELGL